MKGGQLNEFLMRRHHEKFPELEEYFSIVFDFEKLGDALESDISSGAAISFSTLSARM